MKPINNSDSKLESGHKSSPRNSITLGANEEDKKSAHISQDIIEKGKKILLRV